MWICGKCKTINADEVSQCEKCEADISKVAVAPVIEYDEHGYVKKQIPEDGRYIVDLKPLMNWRTFSNAIGVISLIGSFLILAIVGNVDIVLGLTYGAISIIFSLFFFMIGKFLHKYCEVSINNTGLQKEILKTLKNLNK